MKKTEKRTTHRKGIPQGAPIPPGKHLSARSRPIDKKKNAEKEKPPRTCTRRSLPIPINMVHLSVEGRRGDFDRMNRDQLIDI
ncbi:hypothetical protein QYF36_008600 [Acer negundo]|nr:hypothetical protein QYF36_008600 [Acer negundo]